MLAGECQDTVLDHVTFLFFFFHLAYMLYAYFAPGPVQGLGEYSQTRQTQPLFLSAGEKRQVGNDSACSQCQERQRKGLQPN